MTAATDCREFRYWPDLAVGFLIATVGAIMLGARFIESHSRGQEFWLRVMAAAVGVSLAILAVRITRVRLRVDGDGIEVRNYFRTYRFRRDEVERMVVVTRTNRPGLAVLLKDGRHRNVHALQGFRSLRRIDPETHPIYRIGREIDALLGVAGEDMNPHGAEGT